MSLPSLLDPPVGFAHRGGMAHGPANTIAAFRLALEMGAPGLESDAWISADGAVVLDHDGVVRSGVRKRRIAELNRAELPPHVPTLDQLYEQCGSAFELSLDVKDAAAVSAIVAAARSAGAAQRLWLCSPNWRQAVSWRPLCPESHLVDSTRIRHMKEGAERRAALLADAGIDAVNLPFQDWSGGLTTLFHRFGRCCLGWDAQQPRQLDELLTMGVDGIFSDHTDRMVSALKAHADKRLA